MTLNTNIKKIAVLGAGVMGAQIAAHCVNVGIPVILFDLPSSSPDGKIVNKNAIALKAIENLKKLKPSPLGLPGNADLIIPANYEDNLDLLGGCDLIIEAIAERMDWKHALYEKVAPHIPAHAIFATNTSGLSIEQLSKGFNDELKKRFCGVHFFNPPRYMHLLELIPTKQTSPEVLDALETFMTSSMGKGVVRAKDTPNFIGNRVGVFSILAVFEEAQKFGLGFDAVDAITGSKLGRAKSATFRTSDVVGLDTMAHVIKTMEDTLQADPFTQLFKVPEVVKQLIAKGALGQKTKAGFYKKEGKKGLFKIAGVGEGIAKAIEEYLKTGTIEIYEKYKKSASESIASVSDISNYYKLLRYVEDKGFNISQMEEYIRYLENYQDPNLQEYRDLLKFLKSNPIGTLQPNKPQEIQPNTITSTSETKSMLNEQDYKIFEKWFNGQKDNIDPNMDDSLRTQLIDYARAYYNYTRTYPDLNSLKLIYAQFKQDIKF